MEMGCSDRIPVHAGAGCCVLNALDNLDRSGSRDLRDPDDRFWRVDEWRYAELGSDTTQKVIPRAGSTRRRDWCEREVSPCCTRGRESVIGGKTRAPHHAEID